MNATDLHPANTLFWDLTVAHLQCQRCTRRLKRKHKDDMVLGICERCRRAIERGAHVGPAEWLEMRDEAVRAQAVAEQATGPEAPAPGGMEKVVSEDGKKITLRRVKT